MSGAVICDWLLVVDDRVMLKRSALVWHIMSFDNGSS